MMGHGRFGRAEARGKKYIGAVWLDRIEKEYGVCTKVRGDDDEDEGEDERAAAQFSCRMLRHA
jgi:hypothetical protein